MKEAPLQKCPPGSHFKQTLPCSGLYCNGGGENKKIICYNPMCSFESEDPDLNNGLLCRMCKLEERMRLDELRV